MTNNVWYSMVEGDEMNELSIMSFKVLVTPKELYEARENGELDCDLDYIELFEEAVSCYANSFEAKFDTAWESAIVMFAYSGWIDVTYIDEYVREHYDNPDELMTKLVQYGAYIPNTVDTFFSDIEYAIEEMRTEDEDEENDEDNLDY